MNDTKLTQEMKDNIKNYNNEIQTITDFVVAIRKTIGMYAGRKGNKGFLNAIREVFQNGIDELMKDSSPCNWLRLYYNEITHMVIMEDNGRGIPFNNIQRVFTQQHTSSNYTKKDGEFSSGMNGVGAKVSNALSSQFIVESYVLGEGRRMEFYDGFPWDKGEVVIKNPQRPQGTCVTMIPSLDALGEITLTATEVYKLIYTILSLTKIGATLQYDYVTADGVSHSETLVNEDGIITDLILKTKQPIIAPVVLGRTTNIMKAELAFTFDSASLDSQEDITSFSNFCPTEAGTHVNGFLDGVTTFFRNYMNKIYLVNNKKVTVNATDVKTGLKAMISVAHLEPIFSGQAKEVLNNEDMHPFVKQVVMEGLDAWTRTNPSDLQKLCQYFKSIAEIRLKSDNEKIKITKTYTQRTNGDPDKYCRPFKDKRELLIVEGDSAKGSAENNRDKNCQGLFPIRGKIPNALDTPKQKFLNNAEVNAIIQIVTCGTMKIGRDFDLNACPWQYIIFMGDADPDGGHIDTLLLYFFMMYMKPLIEAGRVYRAVPPLYGATMPGGKMKYFVNNEDFIAYVQGTFTRDNVVATMSGKTLTKNEISKLFYDLYNYKSLVDRAGTTFAIHPELLEFLLTAQSESEKFFKKEAQKRYRFLENASVTKDGTFLIKGLLYDKAHDVVFNQTIKDFCKPITELLDKCTEIAFLLNGQPVTLYQLMCAFEDKKPRNLTRYKGLGEMDANQLAESTMLPTSSRTLIRYTIEDAEDQIARIRYINSNKKELLTNIVIDTRNLD